MSEKNSDARELYHLREGQRSSYNVTQYIGHRFLMLKLKVQGGNRIFSLYISKKSQGLVGEKLQEIEGIFKTFLTDYSEVSFVLCSRYAGASFILLYRSC